MDLCSFRQSELKIVRFEECRMEEADFSDAQLRSAMFSGCDLSRVTLTGASFAHSEIRGCDLSGARGPERLRGIRMPWTDVIKIAGELAAGLGIEILDE
jgi:Pentapeptide repeats (9 copies)